MPELAYTVLWSIYAACAALLLLIAWSMTRRWRGIFKWLRNALLLAYVLLVAVPAPLSSAPDSLAPAFIVVLFDYWQGDKQAASDALSYLVAAFATAAVLYLIYLLARLTIAIRRKRSGHRKSKRKR
ncbi:MAG: hypothetical protein GDA55_00755 [Cellvibrionales bacterium]|nr:hypothetical protein [Cellvibrionales bacterium]